MTLNKQLSEYGKKNYLPLHMPGHKRLNLWDGCDHRYDFTEVEGLDNLHHAEGILREAMSHAAACYGADESFFLVNGSTAGVMAAIYAATCENDSILIARNSHKSAYHAVLLRHLKPVYLYPSWNEEWGIFGTVSPEAVREGLIQNPDCKAVFLTSPTYEGVSSDICAIAEIVHSYQKILIVDQAHGAHFGWSDEVPESAVQEGADLVIMSLHKTLPCLTQSAILHKSGTLVDRGRLLRGLALFQTSSPSYILMADMDECLHGMEREGKALIHRLVTELDYFDSRLLGLTYLRVIRPEPCKILILTPENRGAELAALLRERFLIETEMTAGNYVLAIVTVADKRETFDRLSQALLSADSLFADASPEKKRCSRSFDYPQTAMSPFEAINLADRHGYEELEPLHAVGRVSAEFAYLYPPGIPIIVPGEVITKQISDRLVVETKVGGVLQGMADSDGKRLRVIKDDR